MDEKLVDAAKQSVKSIVPSKLLDSVWGRYLQAKSKHELTVAKSLVSSPEELDEIQRRYAASNNARDFLTIEWLRRRVTEIQEPALRSYFAIPAEDGQSSSLGAPADCYRALIDAIIAVSVQSNVQIGYMLQGNRVIISNYAQLVRDLQNRAWTELFLLSFDKELAVCIERWEVEDAVLVAPRANPITRKIYLESPSAQTFFETPGKSLKELYSLPLVEECTFDVDVVYTWVNFEDPEWREMMDTHTAQATGDTPAPIEVSPELAEGEEGQDIAADRFVSRDELKYSLRSLLKYAPWVGTVYIVTNCKPPEWFDETNDRVRWVYHEDIIDAAHLPTFNSHAIEASVHRIPGLSEHFLYFNDDLFLLKPVEKSDFFLPNGLAKIRPEPYGMVHGEIDAEDPDYINAARNVQALLQTEFGKTATKLHTHSPQSMRLSVVQACEQTFPEAYENTRSHKFRSIRDISPTSFMYPSFAYLSGNAVMDYPNISLVSFLKPYRKIFKGYTNAMISESHSELPLTLCINDGGGSSQDDNWGQFVVNFMQSAFDGMSEAEQGFGTPNP